jgi:hypothetical protein
MKDAVGPWPLHGQRASSYRNAFGIDASWVMNTDDRPVRSVREQNSKIHEEAGGVGVFEPCVSRATKFGRKDFTQIVCVS